MRCCYLSLQRNVVLGARDQGGEAAEGWRLGGRGGRERYSQRHLQAVFGPVVGYQGPQKHEEVSREAIVGRHSSEVPVANARVSLSHRLAAATALDLFLACVVQGMLRMSTTYATPMYSSRLGIIGECGIPRFAVLSVPNNRLPSSQTVLVLEMMLQTLRESGHKRTRTLTAILLLSHDVGQGLSCQFDSAWCS